MTAQLQKMLLKIPVNTHATISVMLLCWFVYTKALFGLEGWLKKTLQRKIIVMDSRYAYNLKKLKSDSNTSVFLWICKTFKNNYFVMFCRCFFLFCYFFGFFFVFVFVLFFWLCEHLWYIKVLPCPCSIKDMLEPYEKGIC